ncbi:MAG: O-antigen ligase family protein [Blastocatellia bacterium]|nr:O-antigen ligase family protein [Blastocatellia bacterium]
MLTPLRQLDYRNPATLFAFGWAAVMLALLISIPPVWNTFMHSWRVELTASVFLLITLIVAYRAYQNCRHALQISKTEFTWIILPVLIFITWSGLSMIWAASPRSALHHTLVWTCYLIFYIAVRHLVQSRANLRKLLLVPGLSLAFFGVLAATGYATYLYFEGGVNLGMVYSKYGEQANTIFPLLLAATITLKGRKFYAGVAVLVMLGLLIFSGLGRINLILFAASFVTMATVILLFPRFHHYRKKLAVIAVAVILSPLPFHIPSFFSSRGDIPIVARIKDEGGATANSNDFRKLMIGVSLTMFAANPIVGIGADNFGFETNRYRANYAAADPSNPYLAQAESEIPERAHNEFLQIAAELGVVGVSILVWLLIGIAMLGISALRRIRHQPLYSIAALLGIAMFLASSLVTSYSFRVMQNGLMFFFVLAVAARFLFTPSKEGEPLTTVSPATYKLGFAAGALACILLAGYSSLRVTSAAIAASATSEPDLAKAIPLYERAMWLDHENADAPYVLALRLLQAERYADAVPHFQHAIRLGLARSADFSYLASAQALANDYKGAEATFAKAVSLYPRSPFVLTRYAALLEHNGKHDAAKTYLDRALQINPRQTRTWWALLTESPLKATQAAFQNKDNAEVMDLLPHIALYAVKEERDIRFPEERFSFNFTQTAP